MLYTSQKVHKKLDFSPNVSTILQRSSSVAIIQHSTSTDTFLSTHRVFSVMSVSYT